MDTREEEIGDVNSTQDEVKSGSEQVQSSSSRDTQNAFKCICKFFKKVKRKFQDWFPEVGMFNQMSISEDEKQELKD